MEWGAKSEVESGFEEQTQEGARAEGKTGQLRSHSNVFPLKLRGTL